MAISVYLTYPVPLTALVKIATPSFESEIDLENIVWILNPVSSVF